MLGLGLGLAARWRVRATGNRDLTSSSVSGKWQAAIDPPGLPSSGGSSSEHFGWALGQRV